MTKRPACQHCGNGFVPRTPSQKYCDEECAYGANLRKQRIRDKKQTAREYNEAVAAVRPVVRKPQPQRTVLRASTLADTPDVPAVAAERGDYLTGAAAATMQATSGGRIGVV